MPEFKLPDVGEGLTEAEIVTWKVKVGDVIKVNDIVVEIETAKSLVELPSPYAGTVHRAARPRGRDRRRRHPDHRRRRRRPRRRPRPRRRRRSDGATRTSGWPRRPAPRSRRDRHVQPGRDRRRREPDARRLRPAHGRGAAPRPPRRREPGDRGRRRRPAAAAGRVRARAAPETADVVEADEPPVPATPAGAPTSRRRRPTYACWRSRRCASSPRTSASTSRTLTPTGPDGTVTRDDVQAARSRPQRRRACRDRCGRPTTLDDPAGARDRREPIKGVRKMMAQAMVDSAFTAPHVTEWITVDVTRR